MDFQFFEFELIESYGGGSLPFTSPNKFIRVAGNSDGIGQLVLAIYDLAWKRWEDYRHDLTSQEVIELVGRIKGLGIPERLPEIEGVPDKYEIFTHYSLKIKYNYQRFYLEITAPNNRFIGQDANNLNDLLEYIVSISRMNPQILY